MSFLKSYAHAGHVIDNNFNDDEDIMDKALIKTAILARSAFDFRTI